VKASFKNPKSLHPDIFWVSSVEQEGCTSVGHSGWHIDGTFFISGNLGLAYFISDGTQESLKNVGLRILHRTTIVGGPERVLQKANGHKNLFMDC